MVRYPKLSQYVIARSVEYLYAVGSIDDILSRPTNISTTGSVAGASYKYLGADWVVTEDLTNIDIALDHAASNFAALDRFGRVVDQLWECYGTTWDEDNYQPDNQYPDHFTYTYNRAGNIATRSTQNATLNETYLYDGLDRLTDVDRANGFDQTWGLDGLGNFSAFDDDGASQTRTTDAANQITGISGTWADPTYDAAGNMISGPKPSTPATRLFYTYDGWNRLAATYEDNGNAVFEPGTDTLIAEYVYDGLGRRVMKTDDRTDVDALSRHYYYNTDWQILEDRETYYGVEEINQYIWSPRYVDSPMVCLHDGNADGDVGDNYSTDWRRYYLTDANHNVTTTLRIDNYNEIVTTANDGASRNVYTPYGEFTRCLEDWTAGGSAEELFDGPMYCGYWYDTDTGLYQVRNRFYDANLSTFLNRDPIGYNGGDENLYRYCGNDPVNGTDPTGELVVKLRKGLRFPQTAFSPTVGYYYVRDKATLAQIRKGTSTTYVQVLSLTADQKRLVSFARGDAAMEKVLARILNVLEADIPSIVPHIVNYWASYVGWRPFSEEEYPRTTGFCGAWVDFHFPHMPKSTQNHLIVKAVFEVLRGYAGHNAIRLEFGNAQRITKVAYLDNGWKGGSDHIFFPSSIPPGVLGNETPRRLKDGKPAPFAAPLPSPPPPRKLTPQEMDAAIERMYRPPSGARPAGGW